MNHLPPTRLISNSNRKHVHNANRTLRYEHLEERQLLAIDIVINPGPGLAGNADALAAFNRAAEAWEVHILDEITVTIDADLAVLGDSNVIGQTGSVHLVGGYDEIRDQLVLDSDDESDEGVVAALPTSSQASFFLPGGYKLDGNVIGTKAALKAAGFTGLDAQFGVIDAEITFNSQFGFDFDRSNGIGTNLMDFETVAAHEIGHALGFTSEVDTIDYYSGVGGKRPRISPGLLDLFRFEENTINDPADIGQFNSFARSLVPGVEANTDQIDPKAGASSEMAMSTGYFTGDGRQASHWEDGDLSGNIIGILDPTLAYEQTIPISQADLRALDLIGYDIVFADDTSTPPPTNSVPVAVDDTAKIGKKSGVASGNVLDNDSDADGDSLTAQLIGGNPTGGSLDFDAIGSFTYTPNGTFTGTDTFNYIAVQADGTSSAPATVTITSGGGSGGGGRGGRNNRMAPAAVGFDSSALASARSSFSLYISPIGLQRDMNVVEASIDTVPTTLEIGLDQVTAPRGESSIGVSSSLNSQQADITIPSDAANWLFANESQLLELSVEILGEEMVEDAGESSALTISEELQDLALAEWGLG